MNAEKVVATGASAPPPAKPRTNTNWDALTKAGLRPVTIWCQQYPLQRNMPYRDESCHSRLPLKAECMHAHTRGNHGGGFLLAVRTTEGKQSAVWPELFQRELEAFDFRCAVCDKQVPLVVNALAQHMRPHAGMTKQAYKELKGGHPLAEGFFNVTLRPFGVEEKPAEDTLPDDEF